MAAAREEAAAHGMAFCHPFDDPAVVAGQGTLGLELMEDVHDAGVRRGPARGRWAGVRVWRSPSSHCGRTCE